MQCRDKEKWFSDLDPSKARTCNAALGGGQGLIVGLLAHF
jgi:hypothetical protein